MENVVTRTQIIPDGEKTLRTIKQLDQHTIDKIAAGEVVERPSSVVKELVENAIDAGAGAVTVEISQGGKKLIRITDNGSGIPKDQLALAFASHATSKLEKVEDLAGITSLGFRGEALSSIAAVSQVEVITKTPSALTGARYLIEGGREMGLEEIGAPDGTTFLVRNLFFNTPARSKFLKTDTSEATDISTLIEQLALSHPEISFKFIMNNQVRLHTPGTGRLQDVIYQVYGRDIARNLLEVEYRNDFMKISGFAGKPDIARGNRGFENYYVNGRYVKNNILAKAIEDAYKGTLMQHKYPFVTLRIEMNGEELDVNVHPRKLEVRFARGMEVYDAVFEAVHRALFSREQIPSVSPGRSERAASKPPVSRASVPEPFEASRRQIDPSGQVQAGPVSLPEERAGRHPEEKPGDSLNEGRQETGSENIHGLEDDRYTEPGSLQGLAEEPGAYEAGTGKNGIGTEKGNIPDAETVSKRDRENDLGTMDETVFAKAGENGLGVESENGFASVSAVLNVAGESVPAEKDVPPDSLLISTDVPVELPETGEEVPVQAEEDLQVQETDPLSVQEQVSESTETPGQNPEPEPRTVPARGEQLELFGERLLDPASRVRHRLIGQLFDTYWLVEFGDDFYMIDQHAAHEKITYERMVRQFRQQKPASQYLQPAMIVTLSMEEESVLASAGEIFEAYGFEIEPYGGREYCIRAVPADLYGFTEQELFHELLDRLPGEKKDSLPEVFAGRLATMSCKAAVKGGNRLSTAEANAMIDELLKLEDPYHCPHGRPTIISMSKSEIEKKFHRIL